ncbi:MAG: hypothetical protein FRX48_01520 [Lasallia pustulata]|uniref:Uncharacterized protein n=1 Tax=Lasallia pustulata TaxID=136370 RepID=A0A5M8Q0K4_9LECA|nr:MAG: hypothetical protein FRX48_01520 [Lasallia pustulata]
MSALSKSYERYKRTLFVRIKPPIPASFSLANTVGAQHVGSGRKAEKGICSGAADHPTLFYEIPKPSLNSGSKAYRLLGLSDLWYRHPTPKEEQSMGSMLRQQGITSVTGPDVSVELSRNENEGDNLSANKQEMQKPQQPAEVLPARLSSPPSKNVFFDTSPNWDGSTDATSSRLQHSGSSSTLRSHGDTLTIPPLVPQHSPSLSARELALPKGSSTAFSSLGLNESWEYTKTDTHPRDSLARNDYADLKRNSPYLDVSALDPKPHSSNGLLSSPHRRIDSPFSTSISSDGRQYTPSSKRSWFGLRNIKRKKFRSRAFETGRLDSGVIHQLQRSSIITISGAKDKVQNWFDGLEEEDCMRSAQRTDDSEYQFHQALEPSNLGRSTPTPDPSDVDKQKYYPMDRSRHFSICARILSFQQGSFSAQFDRPPTHHGLQSLEIESTRCHLTQQNPDSGQICESLFLNNNLQKQSILALSSSEDDSEDEVEPTVDSPRRCIRGSVDEPASSDVSLHSAQQVAYSRSGPIVTKKGRMLSRPNPHPDHAIARDGNRLSVQDQPPASSKSSISNHHRDSSQRTSHLELGNDITLSNPDCSSPQPVWPIEYRLPVTCQPRRMVAVTDDEAHLLEAMRLGETSTTPKAPERYSIFPVAKSKNGVILRPNNVDTDPHTSFHQAGLSTFPSPPSLASTKITRRSLRANSTKILAPPRVVASSSSLETFYLHH